MKKHLKPIIGLAIMFVLHSAVVALAWWITTLQVAVVLAAVTLMNILTGAYVVMVDQWVNKKIRKGRGIVKVVPSATVEYAEQGLSYHMDLNRWGFQCSTCEIDRFQSYAPEGEPGGVTVEEAEVFGWRRIDGGWQCPFCTGNTDNLRSVFDGKPPRG